MSSNRVAPVPRASSVDPDSIRRRMSCIDGVELYTRAREPGAVELKGGQSDHLLMCTQGRPIPGQSVHSVLRSDKLVREWTQCPQWHVTFVPAGTPMEWEWSYRSRSINLAFRPNVLTDIWDQVSGPSAPEPAFRLHDPDLAQHLHDLLAEAERGDVAGSDLALTSLINLVAVSLIRLNPSRSQRQNGESSDGRSSVLRRQFHRLLVENLENNVTIEQLAAEVNLSARHFARLFRRELGMPPHRYQLQLRINKARQLLKRDPHRKLVDIALSLGFVDESHFRRHFKRIVGVTPSEFRE